jgi:hypothetical protein
VGNSDFEKVIAIYDTLAPQVLDISITLKSGKHNIDLSAILSLGDSRIDDPFAVMSQMDKLPSMLTFYAELKNGLDAALAREEEDFDIWYNGEFSKVQSAMIQELDQVKSADGKGLPASLKKPPTVGEVRGAVMARNQDTWRIKQGKIQEIKHRIASMQSIVYGIKARIDLSISGATLLNTLINKGLTEGKKKPFNNMMNGR